MTTAAATTMRLSVLLVEDNPADVHLLRAMLSDSRWRGIEIESVSRLGAAVDRLSRGGIDVVLLDLFLPDSHGLSTFTRLKLEAPNLPIIVLSGMADESLAARAVREGAQDYLPKGHVDGELLARSMRYAVERHSAEQAQREASDRLRRLSHALEQCPSIIQILGVDGRIEYVNHRFTQITGYTPTQAIGAQALSLAGLDPVQEREILDTVLSTGEWKGELLHSKAGGQDFKEFASMSVVRTDEGVVSHIVKVGEDVTEHRALVEQLLQSQKMEAVGRLAGGVAHDFNNLLMVIMGYSDFLLNRFGPAEPLRKEVEEIGRAADRAASLTRQLLLFSRREIIEPRTIDLNTVTRDLEKMLRRLIGEDIQLLLELSPSPASIKADPGEMEQALLNLALNARDAMPEGGRLTLHTACVEADDAYCRRMPGLPRGSQVLFSVTDTGVGMDEPTQTRVFEPFFTTKAQGKGTGLGLSNVYGIVRRCEGDIRITSSPGIGTTFTLHFPRADEAPGTAQPEIDTLEALNGTETILLAEDEGSVRDLVRKVLQHRGYTVIEAAEAEEAQRISAAHQGEVHLLISDVVMPGMSGRVLAKRLELTRPSLKVLFMSGYTNDRLVYRDTRRSGAAFLQKPFTPVALLTKVREVLDAAAVAGTGPAQTL